MSPERLKRITTDPQKCGGRPCIRGLRIRVKDILELLSAGATNEEILALRKNLTRCSLLRGLHESDEFGSNGSHVLGLQQQVAEVHVPA